MLGASERRARSVLLDEYCRSTGLEVGERRRIAKIRAAQIDRELAPYRRKEPRRGVGSGTLAAMQREISVRC